MDFCFMASPEEADAFGEQQQPVPQEEEQTQQHYNPGVMDEPYSSGAEAPEETISIIVEEEDGASVSTSHSAEQAEGYGTFAAAFQEHHTMMMKIINEDTEGNSGITANHHPTTTTLEPTPSPTTTTMASPYPQRLPQPLYDATNATALPHSQSYTTPFLARLRQLQAQRRIAKGQQQSEVVDVVPEEEPQEPEEDDEDEEVDAAAKQGAEKPVLPYKYVFHILSPDMITLPSNSPIMHEAWEPYSTQIGGGGKKGKQEPDTTDDDDDNAKSDGDGGENKATETTTSLAIHLHLLLVSLLNRFIRQDVIARQAIHMVADPHSGMTTIQILLPDNANLLAEVKGECELLGIGTLVGMVYACPLVEVSNHNNTQQADNKLHIESSSSQQQQSLIVAQPHVIHRMSLLNKGGGKAGRSDKRHRNGGIGACSYSASHSSSGTDEDDDESSESLSSHVHSDDEGRPPPTQVSFLDRHRIAHHHQNLSIRARKSGDEWRRAGDGGGYLAESSSCGAGSTDEDDYYEDDPEGDYFDDDNEAEPNHFAETDHLLPKKKNKTKITKKKGRHGSKDGNSKDHKGTMATTYKVMDDDAGKTAKTKNRSNNNSTDEDDANSPDRRRWLVKKVVDARYEWLETASCVRVEQVAHRVSSAAIATLSLDSIFLVLFASCITVVGLVTDQAVVTLFSGMFVSTVLGPVAWGMVFFGAVLQRRSLFGLSLRNQALVLLISVAVGFLGGVCTYSYNYDDSDHDHDLPTDEMMLRGGGDWAGGITGVMVALCSGAAMALGKSNKIGGSGLVSVLISWSLLPPAVNAGVCGALSMLNDNDVTMPTTATYFEMAFRSSLLTAAHVFCIASASSLTFFLKEKAAGGFSCSAFLSDGCALDAASCYFWSRDVPIARKRVRKQQQSHPQRMSALLTRRRGLVAAPHNKKTVRTINSGLKAAVELRRLRRLEKHVHFGNDNDEESAQFDPPLYWTRSESGNLRVEELLRARNILFDNTLLAMVAGGESEDGENRWLSQDDVPTLPEDFAVDDQLQVVNHVLGACLFS